LSKMNSLLKKTLLGNKEHNEVVKERAGP
jgi:hypothetical protein